MAELNVLVVDDSEDVRILTGKWLKEEGYNIISASDGNECIKLLKKNLDVIFLDIMMPGPGPAKLIQAIKKKSPNAIVIYLTAVETFNLTPDQEEKGWAPVLEPPVMGYLHKPINKNQLIEKINDAMQMHNVVVKGSSKKNGKKK